jgi:hypothetical protein
VYRTFQSSRRDIAMDRFGSELARSIGSCATPVSSPGLRSFRRAGCSGAVRRAGLVPDPPAGVRGAPPVTLGPTRGPFPAELRAAR